MIEEISSRITDLEIKVSYQDNTIIELNKIIAFQSKHIDAIETEIKKISARLKDLGDNSASSTKNDDKPPHY